MKYFLIIVYCVCFIFIFIKLNTLINDIIKVKNNDNYGIISGNILNKTTYKDEILTINDVIAVSKEVYTYQWLEVQEVLNKITKYSYKKEWSKKIIDSKYFKDKTKSNDVNKNIYTSNYFVLDNIKTKNHIINKNYYINEIKLKQLDIKAGKVFYGVNKKNKKYYGENKSSYTDLDSYVSSNDNYVAKYDKDKFVAIKDGILFNGRNIKEPEIGDVLVIYKVFKANDIYFFGELDDGELKSYKNYFITSFSNDINSKLDVFKIKIILMLSFGIIIMLFLIKNILKKLKQTRLFTLKYIPFFNEYFVYSKNINFISIILFLFSVLTLFNLYIFAIIVLIPLIIARELDYFSI